MAVGIDAKTIDILDCPSPFVLASDNVYNQAQPRNRSASHGLYAWADAKILELVTLQWTEYL